MYVCVIHLRWHDGIGMICHWYVNWQLFLLFRFLFYCLNVCGVVQCTRPFSLSTNNIRTKMIPSSQFINFRAKVGKNMKFTTFALFQWNLHFPNVLLNSISTFFSGKLKLSIDSNYPALFSNLKSNNNITYSSSIILIIVVSKTK